MSAIDDMDKTKAQVYGRYKGYAIHMKNLPGNMFC